MSLVLKTKALYNVWLTAEEIALIEAVRRVIWGSVEVIVKNGEVKLIKKTVESYNLDSDNIDSILSRIQKSA